MAAHGPVQQVLRVFETIDAHFKAHPELLNTDGIFRISSGGTKHIQLAEAIQSADNPKKIDWNQYSAHDCANALKYVLLQARLLPGSNERVIALSEAIQNSENSDLLKPFIESLNRNEDEAQIAKILNIALDICRRTTLQQKYNQMSPYNLSVVWGPCFQHCLNVDPKGDDLHAHIAFMGRINPVIQAGIESGLAKVLPEVVGLRRRTLFEASQMYQTSQALLTQAGQQMAAIRQQQNDFKTVLGIKEDLLKRGKLKHDEKKMFKKQIKDYIRKIALLEMQLQNWKPEAKRHLDYVTKFQERSEKMIGSCDRLEAMLSEISTSTSDDDNSIDYLLNNPPVAAIQFEQQRKDDGSDLQSDLSASSSYHSDLDSESNYIAERAVL